MPEYYDFQLATITCGILKDKNVAVVYKDSEDYCYCELANRGEVENIFILIPRSHLRFWGTHSFCQINNKESEAC